MSEVPYFRWYDKYWRLMNAFANWFTFGLIWREYFRLFVWSSNSWWRHRRWCVAHHSVNYDAKTALKKRRLSVPQKRYKSRVKWGKMGHPLLKLLLLLIKVGDPLYPRWPFLPHHFLCCHIKTCQISMTYAFTHMENFLLLCTSIPKS